MLILPAKYPQFFDESCVLSFADESGWQWTPADVNPFNKTEQLEAYYAMRRGIGLVGTRAWSGSRGTELSEVDVAPSIDFYSPIAPGQNLDRDLPFSGSSGRMYSWTRSNQIDEIVKLGQGSKGMNYTLTLSANGPFTLSGPDNTLSLNSKGGLVFNADGYRYPLRSVGEQDALELDPGHPRRIWANFSTSTHNISSVIVQRAAAQHTFGTVRQQP